MNSITITLVTASTATVTYNYNGTPFTQLTVKFGSLPIKCEAWGQQMADKLISIKPSTSVLITGELQVRDRQPAIVVTSVEVLPTLLSINHINMVGRTGRDVQLRFTESGKTVSNVSLAVRRDKENSDWFDCTFWDRTAEIAMNYATKGSLIGISGRLGFDTWSDRSTGELRVKPVITVDKLDLLGSKKTEELVAA